jgi:DNA-binding NarL/FixJ family response regulator
MNCNPARSLNVLVMHSDPLLRAGLVAALRERPSLEIVVHGGGDLHSMQRPVDVVIADYWEAMRLTNAAGRRALELSGEARILALTAHAREGEVRRAIEAGVHGYVLLGGSLDELVEGVTTVGSGGRYLCRAVAQRMADSLTQAVLTMREVEVLRLVATGQPNKLIARQLEVELGTVKSHVRAIMAKLGAATRTQAASIAVARGLVDEFRPVPMATPAWRSTRPQARLQFA